MTARTGTRTARHRGTLTAVLAGFALLPVLLAGCSGGGTGPTASASADAAGNQPSAAELGDCLRGKGHDVDDSEVGGKQTGGTGNLTIPDGVDPGRWSDDYIACLGSTGAGEATEAQPVSGDDELQRKSAACIRDGGFPDYPDDPEDQRRWKPGDADVFERVARGCDNEVFGTGGKAVG